MPVCRLPAPGRLRPAAARLPRRRRLRRPPSILLRPPARLQLVPAAPAAGVRAAGSPPSGQPRRRRLPHRLPGRALLLLHGRHADLTWRGLGGCQPGGGSLTSTCWAPCSPVHPRQVAKPAGSAGRRVQGCRRSCPRSSIQGRGRQCRAPPCIQYTICLPLYSAWLVLSNAATRASAKSLFPPPLVHPCSYLFRRLQPPAFHTPAPLFFCPVTNALLAAQQRKRRMSGEQHTCLVLPRSGTTPLHSRLPLHSGPFQLF